MKFPLRKPIQANGEQVNELELREPTAQDLILIGMPMAFSADGGSEIKMSSIAKYVSRLAGIPPTSVLEIAPSDLMDLAIEIVGFFSEPESIEQSFPERSLNED